MGRPETKIDYAEVQKLASRGLTEAQIASCMGFNVSTLVLHKKKYSALSRAIIDGKAQGLKKITNALFDCAENGSVRAQEYYLNRRGGKEWQETKKVEVTGPDGGPLQTQELVFTPIGNSDGGD